MDFAFYFVFFCLVWWIVLFIILPIGILPIKNPMKGHEAGAPLNPRIKFKFILTTFSAALITILLIYLVEYKHINLDFLKN